MDYLEGRKHLQHFTTKLNHKNSPLAWLMGQIIWFKHVFAHIFAHILVIKYHCALFKKSQTLQSELLRSLLNCISAPVFFAPSWSRQQPSNLFLYLKHCISSDFSNHKFNDFALKAFDRLSVFFILNQTMSY